MLKLAHAVNALVASVLVVPAVTLQSRQADSLEQALRDTVQALEFLTGLEKSRETEGTPPAEVVAATLQATEEPILDEAQRDARLVALRDSVGRLNADLDLLHIGGGQEGAPITTGNPPAGTGEDSPLVTTGLDARQRELLGEIQPPSAHSSPEISIEVPVAKAEAVPHEGQGFSADRVGEGRALYRAQRYAEAYAALQPLGEDPRAVYWSARALEKLGRSEEALAAYRRVTAFEDGGPEADRARTDIEFLQWKIQLSRKLQPTKSEK